MIRNAPQIASEVHRKTELCSVIEIPIVSRTFVPLRGKVILKVNTRELGDSFNNFRNAHRHPAVPPRQHPCDLIVMTVEEYNKTAYQSREGYISLSALHFEERAAVGYKKTPEANIREQQIIARTRVRDDTKLNELITQIRNASDQNAARALYSQSELRINQLFPETQHDRWNGYTILYIPYQLSAARFEFDRRCTLITPADLKSYPFQQKIRRLTENFRNEDLRQVYSECLESLSYGGINFERKAEKLRLELRKLGEV